MNDVPLIKTNSINDINISLIAIKKQLRQLNEALGLVDIPDVDTSVFVKKSDVVDVVESGNLNPVTSNAVNSSISEIRPINYIESGNLKPITSNAIAEALVFDWNTSGFDTNYGNGYCYSQKFGKMVVVSIRCTSVTVQIPGGAVFATIPQGFRPKRLEKAVIAVIKLVSSTFSSESAIQIDTAGRVIQWITDIPVGAEFDILFVYELA